MLDERQQATRILAIATVLDDQGQEVALSDLWRDQSVVLVFVRHFG